MNKKNLYTMTAAAVMAAALIIAGCSDKKDPNGLAMSTGEADSLAGYLTQQIEDARLARAESDFFESGSLDQPEFSDMILADSVLYAVSGNDLVIYNLSTKTEQRVFSTLPLVAVTSHNGRIYVGGDALYELVETVLEPVPAEFNGRITALYSHDYRLMIGTTDGLFAWSIFGNEALFDGITVTAMTSDIAGLWVGTDGQGLYRWNGAEFKRRYLHRDTSLFDCINALDFSHNHLFVGTDDALYVYNGGRWETMTTANGLPSNTITAIDASAWVVYVGTPSGVVSWFNYEIKPVAKLSDIPVNLVRVLDNKVFAAGDSRGLLMKRGPVVSTIVEPMNIDEAAREILDAASPMVEPAVSVVPEPEPIETQPTELQATEPVTTEPATTDSSTADPVATAIDNN